MNAEDRANFKAKFFADNHAIFAVRGGSPDRLDQEDYGWYRFDDDRLCISGTLGAHRDCFAVYQTGDGLSFVLTGEEIEMTTDLLFDQPTTA